MNDVVGQYEVSHALGYLSTYQSMERLRFFLFSDVVPSVHLSQDIGAPLRAMKSNSENSPFVGVSGGNFLEVSVFGKPDVCLTDVGGCWQKKKLGGIRVGGEVLVFSSRGKGAPKGVSRGNFSRFGRGRSPSGARDSNEVLSRLDTALSLGGFSATPIACGSKPVAFLIRQGGDSDVVFV